MTKRWFASFLAALLLPAAALPQTQSLEGLIDNSPTLPSAATSFDKVPVLRNRRLYHVPSVSPVKVYVSPTGNDSNSCELATPCATLRHALTAATNLANTNGQSLYLHLLAGTYDQSFFVNGALLINSAPNPNGTSVQPGQVVIEGDSSATTTLASSGFCAVIGVSSYANVAVRALRIVGNGTNCQSSLFVQMAGTAHILDDVDFGPATVEQIHIENSGSSVQSWFSYKISGGAYRHITASVGSYINSGYPSGVITFVGTPAFTSQFAWATNSALIQFNSSVAFAGSFVGVRYQVNNNGVIATYPSTSLTWIPGTLPGVSYTGGVYQGPAPSFTYGAIAQAGDGTYFKARCIDLDQTLCENQTWTPTVAFGGLSTGITYTSQIGYYGALGKITFLFFDFTLSSKGSAPGAAAITGLPTDRTANSSQPGSCAFGLWNNLNASVTGPVVGYVNSGTLQIILNKPGAGTLTALGDADFTATTRIAGSCTYATN